MLSPRRQAQLRALRYQLNDSGDRWAEARAALHRAIVEAALDPDEDATQAELAEVAGYTRERVTQLVADARRGGVYDAAVEDEDAEDQR